MREIYDCKCICKEKHLVKLPLIFYYYYYYYYRLAELVAVKKGEDYATTMSWIRARTSFALLRSALTCLRGSRARKIMYDIKNIDFNIENAESAISQTF